MSLYSQAESNIRKTWFYLFFFFVLIVCLGWFLSYYFQDQVILYLAVLISFLLNFFSYWFSDKVVLATAHARPIEKSDNPELYRLVENLCITAGLPLPKIYILQEAQPNAFATGRDKNHAVIAVTQGLLDKLERAELEGVISHELSHIGNKDMFLQTIIVVLVGFVAIITNFFLRSSFYGRSGRRSRNEGQLEAIMMLIGLALVVLAPIIANLMKLAISRKREFLADASGALLTRYPEGLARALEKISADQNVLSVANNATSHLYISNPFRGKAETSWLSKMFLTHPPTEERVKALREMEV